MPTINEKVIKEYPHIPIIEKGCKVKLLNDQIADKGVQGKPQNIFDFIQSKILKINIIKSAENKLLKSLLKYLIV